MNKYYISSDIEGVSGICDWSETELGNGNYLTFGKRMTDEVLSICKGLNKADDDCEIMVKDAHDTARNICHNELPKNVSLNRGWSGNPLSMMDKIDDGFTASIFTGYHCGAFMTGNPLAHTMDTSNIIYMKINGEIASEFLFNYYISHYYNVPVIMVSGDEQLCKSIEKINPNITTVISHSGCGKSVTAKHPEVIQEELKKAAQLALTKVEVCRIKIPETFEIEICLKEQDKALRASFYPGVKMISGNTLIYKTTDYFEVMRMLLFI